MGKEFSDCDVCGNQAATPNVKIVGGVDAVQKSWPSVGLLQMKYFYNGYKYYSYCTLTLIDRRTVITSANCKINIPISCYTVYLGLYKLSEVTSGGTLSSYVQKFSITSFTTVILLKFILKIKFLNMF